VRQRHRKLTETELTEAIRALLVSLAYPPAYGYCEVPVLTVAEWGGSGYPLDGWGKGFNAEVFIGKAERGTTPETYGHNEADAIVRLLHRMTARDTEHYDD